MRFFPKVIWDNYCCCFGARIDKCPSWPDYQDCMGTANYWKKDKLIMLNPNRIRSPLFTAVVLLHEFIHHLLYVFRFPDFFHKILDHVNIPLRRFLET